MFMYVTNSQDKNFNSPNFEKCTKTNSADELTSFSIDQILCAPISARHEFIICALPIFIHSKQIESIHLQNQIKRKNNKAQNRKGFDPI